LYGGFCSFSEVFAPFLAYMRIEKFMTDATVIREIGARLARYRLDRNMSQASLAEEAGLGLRTLQRLEGGAKGVHFAAFLRVCRVLGFLEHIDVMVPEAQPSPMQIIEFGENLRKRARKPKAPKKKKPWSWGS
jgi:putative transcriptional regulator